MRDERGDGPPGGPAASAVAASTMAPLSAVRRSYLDSAILGYMLYGVGAVSAYLRDRLALSDTETGLHSSAMAVGLILAGLTAERLDGRLGSRSAHAVALLLIVAGCAALALAPALPVSLGGALAVGVAAGILLGHVNATLTSGGGSVARQRIGRGNLIAMITALSMPIVLGFAVTTAVGWEAVFLPVIATVALALAGLPGRVDAAVVETTDRAHLGRAFWLAWILVCLVVSAEFSNVFWGSTLVSRQAGVSLGDATLVTSAFYLGMLLGRVVLGTGRGSAIEPIRFMRIGLVVALAGALVAWMSSSVPASALGLLLGGLGIAVLYPVGVSVALTTADQHRPLASARLTLSSGTAILVAPFVLGVVADAVGVVTGWLLVPALCVASLALTWPVARALRAHGLGPGTSSSPVESLPAAGSPGQPAA